MAKFFQRAFFLGCGGLLTFISFSAPAYAVADRDCLSFGLQYDSLLHTDRYSTKGYGMTFVTDYRWQDLYLLSFGIDLSTQTVPRTATYASGRVFEGKLHSDFGLTKFLPSGKWGGQVKGGPGMVFVRDNTLTSNSKVPGLGLMVSAGIVWRPYFTSQYAYNSFVITLKADYWRYFFRQKYMGPDSLTVGPLFGVEF